MSFKRFDPEDLVLSADSITSPAWAGNTPTMQTFFTSSTQVAGFTGEYYYTIYKDDPSTSTSASVQFDIAYGDEVGSGSSWFNNLVPGVGASRVVYGQYRTLVLGDENSQFVFGDVSGSKFHALSIERSCYKEKIFPGFNLTLTSGSNTIQLTDNSKVQASQIFNDAGRVYQIISGSDGSPYAGNGYAQNSASYGLFLPDIGTLMLNTNALTASAAEGGVEMRVSNVSNADGSNPKNMFN